MLDAQWTMVGCSTLGCSKTNRQMTMTDARHVRREANADDLAAVRGNGCSGNFLYKCSMI